MAGFVHVLTFSGAEKVCEYLVSNMNVRAKMENCWRIRNDSRIQVDLREAYAFRPSEDVAPTPPPQSSANRMAVSNAPSVYATLPTLPKLYKSSSAASTSAPKRWDKIGKHQSDASEYPALESKTSSPKTFVASAVSPKTVRSGKEKALGSCVAPANPFVPMTRNQIEILDFEKVSEAASSGLKAEER